MKVIFLFLWVWQVYRRHKKYSSQVPLNSKHPNEMIYLDINLRMLEEDSKSTMNKKPNKTT